MQYVIEKKLVRFGSEKDEVVEEVLEDIDESAARSAAKKAENAISQDEGVYKVVLWEEYESMEEAPLSEGGCYRLLCRDKKLWLRVCLMSTERRG